MHIFYLLTLLSAVLCADMYANDPNVFELNPSNFDKVVYGSKYTTMVKFYAPWCGYCKQMHGIYKRLGQLINKDTKYAHNIAAVNCDNDANKALCAKHQIQGFPTIMVFRPPKYTGKKKQGHHATEVYNGDRKLKAMTEFLNSRLKNYVKKFTSASGPIKDWFDSELPSFLLITHKQETSPLLRSLAVDFLGSAQIGHFSAKSPVKEITVKDTKVPVDNLSSVFLYYNGSGFETYEGDLRNKTKVSEWMMEVGGVVPGEGPLSEREKKMAYYRSGKKVRKSRGEHDEL